MSQKFHLLAFFLLFLALGREVRACDTRHFYNNSSTSFVFAILPTGSCSIGAYTGPLCVIPPGQAADLHYPDSSTNIAVGSVDGTTYGGNSFSVGGVGTCYINHSGNTGNIVVNGPANGDVTTCGGSNYPCQAPAKKSK